MTQKAIDVLKEKRLRDYVSLGNTSVQTNTLGCQVDKPLPLSLKIPRLSGLCSAYTLENRKEERRLKELVEKVYE